MDRKPAENTSSATLYICYAKDSLMNSSFDQLNGLFYLFENSFTSSRLYCKVDLLVNRFWNERTFPSKFTLLLRSTFTCQFKL